MFLRRCSKRYKGRRHSYWTLVESVRTGRGPRQRVVAYLGEMDESGRLGLAQAAGLLASGLGRRQVVVMTGTNLARFGLFLGTV